MAKKIKFISYGLGKIGKGAARILISRAGTEMVGVIDADPKLIGKDAAEVLGLNRQLGVRVSDDPEETLSKIEADIVILATRSWINEVYPEIALAMKYGKNLVTSAEEITNPWSNLSNYARKIDAQAREAGVSVFGTGCGNFFSYPLIAALVGDSEEVEEIHASMVFDLAELPAGIGWDSVRRGPTSVGWTVEEFNRMWVEHIKAGAHSEKGKRSTLAPIQLTPLLADTLGWKLERIEQSLRPVTSKHSKKYGDLVVEPGKTCGQVTHTAGIMDGKEVITHDWHYHLDPEQDGIKQGFNVEIKGLPKIEASYEWDICQISPQAQIGNEATYRAIANAVPFVVSAPPGLVTFMDLPTITYVKDLSKMSKRLNEGLPVTYVRPAGP